MGFSLMATNDFSSENPRSTDVKKPYEKPAFRHEKVFVTTALSCGKTGAIGQSCIGQTKSS
jgi:hypothetical protein